MTTVTSEEVRGAAIDYGGSPPAPTAARQTIVQSFDDGTSRVIERAIALGDLTAGWDAALVMQRDGVAADAGAKARRIQELEAQAASDAETIATLTRERDQARAAYEQLLSQLEPV